MIRPDSDLVLGHVEALRAAGSAALRARRPSEARARYVLAAAWTRYAFDACSRDAEDDAACVASLCRDSRRLLQGCAP